MSDVPVGRLRLISHQETPLGLLWVWKARREKSITYDIRLDDPDSGCELQRRESRERARSNQIMSIVDSYAYWPLVRQVFSHGVFRPRMGQPSDDGEICRGLDAAPRLLSALEKIASDEQYLCGSAVSLADIHLAPMIGYFVLAPEGEALLRKYTKLSNWWLGMSQRGAYLTTMPRLPNASLMRRSKFCTPATEMLQVPGQLRMTRAGWATVVCFSPCSEPVLSPRRCNAAP
jgi:Glutathione S-transferase, C-terminal domain